MSYEIGPYDPCPCGSGAKYKFCCAAKAKAHRHGKYPSGTVAHYGPDDQTTTKIAAGVILREGAGVIIERWVGANVVSDPAVAQAIKRFFAKHGVKSVVATSGNLGCPHEEGVDFPRGQNCPVCPFWAGKQGTAARGGEWRLDFDDEEWNEDETTIDDEILDEARAGDADRNVNEQFARVEAIVGGELVAFETAIEKLAAHLRSSLQLPCEVTGIEDFQWEERYAIGGWSPAEYRRLKKTQPSCRDRYQLLSIDSDGASEWTMCNDDIAAHVRRTSDGREFVLGLSELKATDASSANHQLLDDFAVWFVNSR